MNELENVVGLGQAPGYRYAELVGDQLLVPGQVPHDNHGNLALLSGWRRAIGRVRRAMVSSSTSRRTEQLRAVRLRLLPRR